MLTHTYIPFQFHETLGPHEPVLYVDDGDTIITTTVDASGKNEKGQRITDFNNALVGPFYINNSEPGDAIKIIIKDISIISDFGYTLNVLAPNVVDPKYIYKLPKRKRIACEIDSNLGIAIIKETKNPLNTITMPLEPMIGTIGVSPKNNQVLSSNTAAEHGGNMDYPGVKKGSTLYFPVFIPGANLFIGDGHARQGHGEILGAGVEIPLKVELSVHILKNKPIEWPRGENIDYVFTMGNARPLDYALQIAITEMLKMLIKDYNFDVYEASLAMGLHAELEIANFVNPTFTVICKLPKKCLSI